MKPRKHPLDPTNDSPYHCWKCGVLRRVGGCVECDRRDGYVDGEREGGGE